ncbi:MAG: zonular occludens toxin domain-containing protein [Candidatus Accumulibacter sp.]|jgi:hypothetical protein|nr:zonular occludens toxin domain-containing protein [Accumulibacter sp.]
MIHLATGLPGAGKTLFTITYVKELAEKENRQVYYSGIEGLCLGWTEIEAEKWMECPAGSIIVIDEAQRLFRPRGNASKVPEYVKELETHRHNGFDLFLTTQHPMLIDANVRRLTERHWHICRRFGMEYATVLVFESCKDQPLSASAKGQRLSWKFPKESYNYYKSAQVHTVKRRLPMVWIIVGLGIILTIAVGGYYIWRRLHPELEVKKPVSTEASTSFLDFGGPKVSGKAEPPSEKKPLSREEYIAVHQPRIEGLPHTAPVYDEVTKPIEAPVPAACWSMKSKGCRCYTQQGTRMIMDKSLCEQIVANGYFRSFLIEDDRRAKAEPYRPKAPAEPAGPWVPDPIPAHKGQELSPGRAPASSSTGVASAVKSGGG